MSCPIVARPFYRLRFLKVILDFTLGIKTLAERGENKLKELKISNENMQSGF